jgi:rubrerythrin
MQTDFDTPAILQIAEKLEHDAGRFYLEASGRFGDPELRNVCRALAKLVGKEQGAIARLRQQLSGKQNRPPAADRRDYVFSHPYVMANLAASARATKETKALTGRETKHEILRVAIGRTEDVIAFCRGLKGFARDVSGTEILERIITAEQDHLARLTSRIRGERASRQATHPQRPGSPRWALE